VEPYAVLVIDDDADYRDVVRFLLEAMGLAVLEAPDCATGLAVLDRERARVRFVLLDYWMPGLAPVECAHALLERAGADIEVVLVTAAVSASERAAELGIRRYLSKPFESEQLERLVLRSAPSPGPPSGAPRASDAQARAARSRR
jgi:CheY-like chemotaxis protein